MSREWSGWRGSPRMDCLIPVSVAHMVLPLTNVRVFLHSHTTLTCGCLLWDLCSLLEHGAEGTPQGNSSFTVGAGYSPINHFLWPACHDFSPKWTTSCLWLTEMTKNYVSKTLRQPQTILLLFSVRSYVLRWNIGIVCQKARWMEKMKTFLLKQIWIKTPLCETTQNTYSKKRAHHAGFAFQLDLQCWNNPWVNHKSPLAGFEKMSFSQLRAMEKLIKPWEALCLCFFGPGRPTLSSWLSSSLTQGLTASRQALILTFLVRGNHLHSALMQSHLLQAMVSTCLQRRVLTVGGRSGFSPTPLPSLLLILSRSIF